MTTVNRRLANLKAVAGYSYAVQCFNYFVYPGTCPIRPYQQNNVADTHSNCSTTAVGTGNQAALCGCQGNLELLPIQVQRSSHAHRYGHVANHILTAGPHDLEYRNVDELEKQAAECYRDRQQLVMCVCVCA